MIDPIKCEICRFRQATATGLCEVCENPEAYGLAPNGHCVNCDCVECGGSRVSR